MSTILYALLSKKREDSAPQKRQDTEPPGIKTYMDTLAALVPSEILGLHAFAIAFTTTTKTIDGTKTTTIANENFGALQLVFWSCLVLTVLMYVIPRVLNKTWNKLDLGRVFIPPFAFVAWMMLQRPTALDAVVGNFDSTVRTVFAAVLAVGLAFASNSLAHEADQM